MNKLFNKALSIILVVSTILSILSFGAAASATEAPEIETVWYGDQLAVNIEKGEGAYMFRSAYVKPRHAYEMSYHMVSNDGGASNEIPQTLVLVGADEDYTWTPDGLYSFGASNYEVLYCCDAETGYANDVYYKRMNLEDGTYYTSEQAAHIRAIVTNSYPFISLEQMKKNLADAGFEGAEDLTRTDVLTAVQAAIWAFSNVNVGEYYYSRTFNVPNNSQWGGVMHDYDKELEEIKENEGWWPTGKRKFATNEEVAARINGLIDHLKGLDKVYAEDNQVIITDIEILGHAPVYENSGIYTVALQIKLNNSGSSINDDIKIDVYVGEKLYTTQAVELGKDTYTLNVEAAAGETVKAVVSGTQILPAGVYFYEAQGGRDVSQSLVGVAHGTTSVCSEVTVEVPEEEKPVKAELSIHKVDQAGYSLPGASFELYAATENTDVYVDSYTVDEDGMLNITDLLPGSYKIKETVAPTNFVKIENEINVVVTEDGKIEAAELPEGVTLGEKDGAYELTVPNKSVTVSISGEKTWVDADNQDGKRPEEITINVYANGKLVESKKVTEADEWKWTFDNLYKYENGKEIVYTITEDAVDGYEAVVDGFNVTNTHNPEKIVVSGTKTWDDSDNLDGIRPEEITIRLYADGVEIASKTVTEADGWAWTFEDLYKYENGAEIVYTITEDAVEGYETVIDGFNVTNVHTSEFTEIEDPEVPLHTDTKPSAPQTGDGTLLWLAAAVVSGGLTAFFYKKRKMAESN